LIPITTNTKKRNKSEIDRVIGWALEGIEVEKRMIRYYKTRNLYQAAFEAKGRMEVLFNLLRQIKRQRRGD